MDSSSLSHLGSPWARCSALYSLSLEHSPATTTTKIFPSKSCWDFSHPLLVGSASCPFHSEFPTSSSQTLYHSLSQPHSTFLPFFTDTSTPLNCIQRPCLLLEPRKVSGTQDLVEKYMLNEQRKKLVWRRVEMVLIWVPKFYLAPKTSSATLKVLRTDFTVSTLLLWL